MIVKHWNDWNGYHEIQLFTFEDNYRAVYHINEIVVEDISFPKDTENIVQKLLEEYYKDG